MPCSDLGCWVYYETPLYAVPPEIRAQSPAYLAAAAVHSLIQPLPSGTAFCIGIVLIVMMTGRFVQTKGSLARRPTGGPLPHLSTVLGQPGAAGCSTERPNLYLPSHPRPALCRPLAAQHASPPQWGTGPGDVSGSLARGRAAPVGQADARSGPAVRVRPREFGSASPKWHCLAGSILAYTAATQQALSTGFWDRAPRVQRPAGCAASWPRGMCKTCWSCHSNFAKNCHPTAHLPTGVCGHRRQKRAMPPLYDQPRAA